MAEEPTSPEVETNEKPSSFINPDGTLVENWHKLAPEGYEELRDDETLPRLKSFWDLGKSYRHVRKQVPLDKIAIPNEHSTDDDWKEWYKAGGRPNEAKEYNLTKPDDMDDGLWNQDFVNSFQEIAHKQGFNAKQVSNLMNWFLEVEKTAREAQTQAEEMEVREIEEAVYKEWGAAKPEKIRMGNLAVEKASEGDIEYKERLLDKINRDVDLIKFAAILGGKFIEAGAPMPTTPTPGDIEKRIAQEMAKPSYMDKSHPEHKHQVDLVAQLFKEKEASMKTGFQD